MTTRHDSDSDSDSDYEKRWRETRERQERLDREHDELMRREFGYDGPSLVAPRSSSLQRVEQPTAPTAASNPEASTPVSRQAEMMILANQVADWAIEGPTLRRGPPLVRRMLENTSVMLTTELAKAAPVNQRWRRFPYSKARQFTSEVAQLVELGRPDDADAVRSTLKRLDGLLEHALGEGEDTPRRGRRPPRRSRS